MSVKACAFGLLAVAVIAAVVDSNKTNGETPRPSTIQKPMVAKKQTRRNYNVPTRNISVEITGGIVNPNLPEVPFAPPIPIPDMFPPDIPNRKPFRWPCGPCRPCGR